MSILGAAASWLQPGVQNFDFSARKGLVELEYKVLLLSMVSSDTSGDGHVHRM